MPIHAFAEAAAFLRHAQPFLERDEVTAAVILGVALRLAAAPPAAPFYLACVDDDHGPLLAAMMTPPFNLSLWSDRPVSDDALDSLARDLQAGGWPVPGAQGEAALAERWAQRWAHLTGQPWRVTMHERIYKLTAVTPPPATPGHLRLATEQDLDLVAGWTLAFEREALDEGTAEAARELATRRLADQQIYVWEIAGEPVSLAAWGRPTATGVTINLVYTPPEQRRRGYAMACVAALSQQQLEAGRAFCTLFTDLANPTSNHIYQQLGYRPVSDVNVYRFDQPAKQEEP